jgi:hypothetical protein
MAQIIKAGPMMNPAIVATSIAFFPKKGKIGGTAAFQPIGQATNES